MAERTLHKRSARCYEGNVRAKPRELPESMEGNQERGGWSPTGKEVGKPWTWTHNIRVNAGRQLMQLGR